jgi:hypothetical protein
VFTTAVGTKMDAANVRRDFRRALRLVPQAGPERVDTPRVTALGRLSSVRCRCAGRGHLSVGGSHRYDGDGVYRHQLRPVIQTGAKVMERLFSMGRRQAD